MKGIHHKRELESREPLAGVLLAFCELSRQDAGFSPIGMDRMDMQFADYDRLLNNMTAKIHRMIIEKQL